MNWNSPAEFFSMGGYALYVWGSFGACALAMIVEPLLLRREHRRLVRSLQRQQAAEAIVVQWSTLQVESRP